MECFLSRYKDVFAIFLITSMVSPEKRRAGVRFERSSNHFDRQGNCDNMITTNNKRLFRMANNRWARQNHSYQYLSFFRKKRQNTLSSLISVESIWIFLVKYSSYYAINYNLFCIFCCNKIFCYTTAEYWRYSIFVIFLPWTSPFSSLIKSRFHYFRIFASFMRKGEMFDQEKFHQVNHRRLKD